MDDIGHKSGHLMLITPERVFYAGLLGRPRATLLGCVQHLCLDRGRAVAHDRRWPRELWRNGRRAPERQAHHCQRPSFGAQHRDRAGERSPRRARRSCKRLSGPEGDGFHQPHSRRLSRTARASRRRRFLQRRIRYPVPWRSAAAARTRSARGARDRADRKILRRAGDGGKLRHGGGIVARRASCICSRKRPEFPSVRSAPGSGRGICCISPTRTSTLRISRRISAIPTPRISATRSAASTA